MDGVLAWMVCLPGYRASVGGVVSVGSMLA